MELFAEFSSRGAYTAHAGKRSLPYRTLRIFRTGDGYLCQKIRHGCGHEPAEEMSQSMVASLAEARAYFGGGWLVDELFERIRFSHSPRLVQGA